MRKKQKKQIIKKVLRFVKDKAIMRHLDDEYDENKGVKHAYICNALNSAITSNKFSQEEINIADEYLMSERPTTLLNSEFYKGRELICHSWWSFDDSDFVEVMRMKRNFLNHIIAKL